ncbi:hypothetical protein HYV31_00445 [candidate division WWE3 bacterium]|nr:hypothetical protein [candidate division WWE3 bacterium]
MNYETQAQNGFKTFVITLSISLVAFSAIYYLISDVSGNVDIENSEKAVVVQTPKQEVAGTTSSQDMAGGKLALDTQPSVFSEISQKPVNAKTAVVGVLGAASESTQSSVPDTGSETLSGALLAGGFFAIALYLLMVGPRKLAIEGFENEILKKS